MCQITTDSVRYCRVDLTDKITPKYSHYLCFTVSVRTTLLMHHQDRWTPQQEETIQLVKKLQKSGLGYRKIAKYLNAKGIKTFKGNSWKNTQVFSYLKRYRERQERLAFIEKEYEPVWRKMEVRWVKKIFKLFKKMKRFFVNLPIFASYYSF